MKASNQGRALRPQDEVSTVCRNIRTLYNFEPPATDDEVRAAALQYVRKISGFSRPSAANEAAFERAVDAVAAASADLLGSLVTTAVPKDRDIEAARAHQRALRRFGA
jgi:hypothetical protein